MSESPLNASASTLWTIPLTVHAVIYQAIKLTRMPSVSRSWRWDNLNFLLTLRTIPLTDMLSMLSSIKLTRMPSLSHPWRRVHFRQPPSTSTGCSTVTPLYQSRLQMYQSRLPIILKRQILENLCETFGRQENWFVITTKKWNGCDLSLLQVPNFWKIYSYDIGGLVYSLDDIEHGVLRANKGNNSAVSSYMVLIVTLISSIGDPDFGPPRSGGTDPDTAPDPSLIS